MADGAPVASGGASAKQQQRSGGLQIVVPDIIEDLSVKRADKNYVKRYQKGRYLGKGAFAKVYEITSMDSQRVYAGKVIPKASLVKASSRRKLLNEIKLHHSCSHDGVVKFERFFEDQTNVYILLELCTNNTLMELMKRRKRLTETETQFYMWQLLTVTTYLHSVCIIHRDLKLGNLLIDKNLNIKVGDFGLATKLSHPGERKRTICGTPNYIAPEILQKEGHSFEVDVWSMGVIMYTLLIGKPPFETASVKSTYKRIQSNSYNFPPGVRLSRAARHLITRILSPVPEQRPSLAEIRNDEFFHQSPFPASLPEHILTDPLEYVHCKHPSSFILSQRGQELVNTLGVMNIGPQETVSDRAADKAGPEEIHLDKHHVPDNHNNNNHEIIHEKSDHSPAGPGQHCAKAGGRAGGCLLARDWKQQTHRPPPPSTSLLTSPFSSSTPSTPPADPHPDDAGPPASPEGPDQGVVQSLAAGADEDNENDGDIDDGRPALPPPPRSHRRQQQQRYDAEWEGANDRSGVYDDDLEGPFAALSVKPEERQEQQQQPQQQQQPHPNHHHSHLNQNAPATSPAQPHLPTSRQSHHHLPGQPQRGSGRSAAASPENSPSAVVSPSPSPEGSPAASPDPSPTRGIAGGQSAPISAAWGDLFRSEVVVTSWVDYSTKYGLGYLLSDGTSGVYYNDATKATLTVDQRAFDYIENAVLGDFVPRKHYPIDNYPTESSLKKKVTLLLHFWDYLSKRPELAGSAEPTYEGPPVKESVYVQYWQRTQHAVLFHLSTNAIQIVFSDKSQLLVGPNGKVVTYQDKFTVRTTIPCRDSLHHASLHKRLTYACQIISLLPGGASHPLAHGIPTSDRNKLTYGVFHSNPGLPLSNLGFANRKLGRFPNRKLGRSSAAAFPNRNLGSPTATSAGRAQQQQQQHPPPSSLASIPRPSASSSSASSRPSHASHAAVAGRKYSFSHPSRTQQNNLNSHRNSNNNQQHNHHNLNPSHAQPPHAFARQGSDSSVPQSPNSEPGSVHEMDGVHQPHSNPHNRSPKGTGITGTSNNTPVVF
eukprot:g795.t1